MTQSTLINAAEVIVEHVCTSNRLLVVTEGNLQSARIELRFRKNLGGATPRDGAGFDDPDGYNIRGTGMRDLAVVPGMIVWPEFKDGGRLPAGSISVEMLDG